MLVSTNVVGENILGCSRPSENMFSLLKSTTYVLKSGFVFGGCLLHTFRHTKTKRKILVCVSKRTYIFIYIFYVFFT
jgi:hypothetical protein